MARKVNYKTGDYSYFRKRYKVGEDINGKPIMKTFYGKSEAEATAKRDKYIEDLNKGLYVDKKPTVEQEYLNWLNTKIKISGVKANTFDRYMTIYNCYVKGNPFFSYKEVDKVTSSDIQGMYTNLSDPESKYYRPKLGYSGYKFLNKQLKRFFEHCKDSRYLIFNPVNSVVIPNVVKEEYHKDETKEKTYSIEDRNKLLNYAKNKNYTYYCIMSLLFKLGCRSGEILGLQIDDIDFKDKKISINSTQSTARIYDNQGNIIEHVIINETTKNSDSTRFIYVNDEILQIFKTNIKDKKLKKLSDPTWNQNNLIFTSINGNPILHSNFRRFWEKACKETKVEYKPPHKSRHTFITQADELGVDKKTIQKIVGHKVDSIITEKVYIHKDEEKIKNATLDVLNNIG